MTGPQPFRRPAIDLAGAQLEAFLVTGAANVRYLTGFTGSNGVVLVTPGGAVFFTDPRYEIQSAQQVACRVQVVRKGGLLPAVAAYAAKRQIRALGFEKDHFSYQQHQYLSTALPRAGLKPVEDVVLKQRMVKTDAEIALIRHSVLTNSNAFARAISTIKSGVTESETAAEIEYQMRKFGADRPSFETIVAFGSRTALPHAHPGPRALRPNELVLIDMGSSQEGYASDMTRVLHLGRIPRKTERMYRAVLEAQLAGLDAVRAGVTAGSVDRAARQVLKKHGLDHAFTHSTGHGLGLEIHEPPRLGKGDKTRLEAGMAITIEPGAYLEDYGGIRIEDTVVVTPSGCEVLTPTSKELIAL
ncbi:MAG: aminopeptidase P family protein [Acidobacteria bacterium]|nr:aminopeptidase P family protein [Acidobacteriota bacterium]